jgi:hypothetical protein
MNEAKQVHSLYFATCEFPLWTLEPSHWNQHAFQSVKVYYHSEDNIDDVKLLMIEREPCNIAFKRFYDKGLLKTYFGYEEGAYRLSTKEKLMPNFALSCYATVKLPKGFVKVYLLHLIGAALDHPYQPDFQYFRNKPVTALINFYRKMWLLALTAVSNSPCKKLQLYNVGGGAFSGWHSNFTVDIFEPAFKPLLSQFEAKGITVLGYDWENHRFTSGLIPACLETADLESTIFVNAWDPWSLLGNGNERDRSLDGSWGRISNIAVLGWLHTNPSIEFLPVN